MYIRTTCGVLGILKHIKLNMYEFNNERYIKNGKRLHNSNHDYTIKLQDEEFINVLEIRDIVKSKRNHKYFISGFSGCKIYCDNNDWIFEKDIKLIITHEQYLPLAQEVL